MVEPESPSVPTQVNKPARPFRVGPDGLPLLPCHDLPPTPCAPLPAPVAQFGHVDSKMDVRQQLERFYAASGQRVGEMMLRIDTELELLRRSCFARRNAQWGNLQPDQFQFDPIPSSKWAPQPANSKLALRQLKRDGHFVKDAVEAKSQSLFAVDTPEYVRDRVWPPKEFALKPLVKPKNKPGRKKAVPMAAVNDPVPLLAKTCKECKTQSTPLWRTQTRKIIVTRPKLVLQGTPTAAAGGVQLEKVQRPIQVDLCLQCFLKLERKDLFNKKKIAKRKQDRRKKEQNASAALQETKKLKQQKVNQETPETQLAQEEVAEQMVLKFTREEFEAATGSKDRKRDRKNKKDKKKKKKHRHKRDHVDGMESEEPTPMVSPAKMDGYVYADRAPDPYATPSVPAFNLEQRDHKVAVDGHVNNDVADPGSVRSSSRKRKSVSRSSPARSVESPVSASKKKKSSSSSRPKRATASTVTTAPAPVVVVAPPTPAVRKRARTKKELERERELRALGQYCPVCSEVYEDDDQNTFVCCDSCELWVHGACDPSLTPAIIAAMTNTDEKYICPLCGGR